MLRRGRETVRRPDRLRPQRPPRAVRGLRRRELSALFGCKKGMFVLLFPSGYDKLSPLTYEEV